LDGGDAMRLHLLPSLVLPAQRTFLTAFFLVTLLLAAFFLLAFRAAMSFPPSTNQVFWFACQITILETSVNKKKRKHEPPHDRQEVGWE